MYRYMPKPLLIVDSYERDKAIRITLVNISKTDTPVRTIFSKVAIQTRFSFRKLSADIVDKGIVLTGGGALLTNLDRVLRKATGLPVSIAEDPLTCVALGTGRALEEIKKLRNILSTMY